MPKAQRLPNAWKLAIVVDYQATPEERFYHILWVSVWGCLKMTRFGMQAQDFQQLAQLMHDVIIENKTVKDEVAAFRKRFLDLQFCFKRQ